MNKIILTLMILAIGTLAQDKPKPKPKPCDLEKCDNPLHVVDKKICKCVCANAPKPPPGKPPKPPRCENKDEKWDHEQCKCVAKPPAAAGAR